jgi:hypothetical protein
MSDVTRSLMAIEHGDARAAEQLLPLVADELRKLAAQRLAQRKSGHTLRTTALVGDAYLRLVDSDQCHQWISRGRFFPGMIVQQAGELLGLSCATTYRLMTFARAGLRCLLSGEGDPTVG